MLVSEGVETAKIIVSDCTKYNTSHVLVMFARIEYVCTLIAQYLLMSTERTHPADLDLRENTAVFELDYKNDVHMLVFLDPYRRGFLFVNFLGRSVVCVGRTVGPNRKLTPVFGFKKVKNFEPL